MYMYAYMQVKTLDQVNAQSAAMRFVYKADLLKFFNSAESVNQSDKLNSFSSMKFVYKSDELDNSLTNRIHVAMKFSAVMCLIRANALLIHQFRLFIQSTFKNARTLAVCGIYGYSRKMDEEKL